MNYLNLFYFQKGNILLYRPAHRSAQAGLQAGRVPEAAGLRAGPDRAPGRAVPEAAGLVAGPGRAPGRARPEAAGRLRPAPGRARGDTAAATAATTAERRGRVQAGASRAARGRTTTRR